MANCFNITCNFKVYRFYSIMVINQSGSKNKKRRPKSKHKTRRKMHSEKLHKINVKWQQSKINRNNTDTNGLSKEDRNIAR